MIIKRIMNVIEEQGVRSEPNTPFVGIAVRTWPTFSLRTRYRPAVSLEQLIEADPRFLSSPPPTCAEILTILSSKLGKLFITPEHLTELHGLHDGTVDYEALQDYAVFRQSFGPEWGIGGSDLSN